MPTEANETRAGTHAALEALAAVIAASRRLIVLSGAGCSTDSGIPDYRDLDGEWKHQRPVQYRDFVCSAGVRQRYWARSLIGWQRIAAARPNDAHKALAALERDGWLHGLITQNVDGLHQRAGHRRVIDLHGRLDSVHCLDCRAVASRADVQQRLAQLNPGWQRRRADSAATTPDGDAEPGDVDYAGFVVPACTHCRGTLKPGVVFFGETVPRRRLGEALALIERADVLLVVGSSLMVFSGYRFVRAAAERGIPIAAINLGRMRADDLIGLKINERCASVLPALASRLGRREEAALATAAF